MLKIGFVGCGINKIHMRNLSAMEGVRLVAFADMEEEKVRTIAAQYGGQAYTDARAMLDTEKLDALYVAVPPAAHGLEIQAVQKGIHIFAEKPVAVSMETAQEIAGAIKKAGVISSVGYHLRYKAVTRRAKEILADKAVAMAVGAWMCDMPRTPWWRQKSLSGGQMVEQATHICDMFRWLVGEVEEVSAFYSTRALQSVPNFDIWDVSSVNLRFENGAVGALQSTCVLGPGQYRVEMELFCKELSLELDGDNLLLGYPRRKEEITLPNDAYFDEDQAFIEAVKSGKREGILCPYEDGVKTLAVSLAANRSAEEGRPVKVKEMFE